MNGSENKVDGSPNGSPAVTPTDKTYYGTFGQRFRRDPHPQGGHPDGWFAIEASDLEHAMAAMHRLCGVNWSNVYSHIDPKMFPKGELRRVKG